MWGHLSVFVCHLWIFCVLHLPLLSLRPLLFSQSSYNIEMGAAQFTEWLREHLATVELDDEVFSDYICGLLEENSITAAEKKETIESFLVAAAVGF